jgi:hypothetical protein
MDRAVAEKEPIMSVPIQEKSTPDQCPNQSQRPNRQVKHLYAKKLPVALACELPLFVTSAVEAKAGKQGGDNGDCGSD